MNHKVTGNKGEAAVLHDMVERGYTMFIEFGDNDKVDFIAMDKNYKTIKIQVKASTEVDGKATLWSYCAGPGGYGERYTKEQVDVFALYIPDRDMILYINGTLGTSQCTLTFRLDTPKNNQKKGIRMAEDYLDFERAT